MVKVKQLLGSKIQIKALTSGKANPPKRNSRREFEELKMQVLEVAGNEMETTIKVLRHWITG